MDIENDVMGVDYHDSADSLAVLMSSGVPEISFDEEDGFKLTIREEDTDEVKDVKRSVEFTISTAHEMIGVLKRFAIQTGNPRFFESINSFLVTINGSIGKLIDMKKASSVPQKDEPKNVTNIQNNYGTLESPVEKPMTTRDAIRLAQQKNQSKLIDATPEEKS
uniref:Terminase small subunit n=1 Tax=Ochrobactrum phage ORM_20 TaxID=2985243 RepID=A0A9N6WS02_9VIRU|nr:terminase small subunit [Ochrobactrum phage ORM_20]